MRIRLGFLFTLATSFVGYAQQTAGNTSDRREETEVINVRDALVDAYIHRNIAVLDGVLADEFSFIDDDGVLLNKQQLLEFFRSGEDKVTSYKRQEDKVRIYSIVAVMTYRCQIEENYKGQDVGGNFRITRIFVKRDSRWKMVGGQDTKISGPQPGTH